MEKSESLGTACCLPHLSYCMVILRMLCVLSLDLGVILGVNLGSTVCSPLSVSL